MAKVEGEYIAVNELFGNKSGKTSTVKYLSYNGEIGRRAILNGVIKFDHWYTTLSASNFSVGAEGGDVATLADVKSYGRDVEGKIHYMDYTLSKTTIGENTDEGEKSGTIKISQEGSGQSLSVSYTQAAAEVNWTVSASVRVGVAPAYGGWMDVTVDWVLYRNGSYYTQGSSTPSSVYMDYSYQSSSQVYVPSAGTEDFSSEHTIGHITSCIFYADGKYFDESFYTAVRRAKNMPSRSWGAYELSISSDKSSFTSSASSATITVDCKQSYTDTWDSGSKVSDKADATASLSTTYGSLTGSSVTGKGSVILSVGNDTGNGYTAKVTASAGNGAKTASVSIPQTKRVEKSRVYHTPTGTPANISTVAVTGNVTVYLTIASWTQSYTITYDNGTTSTGSTSGTNASAIVTKGSGINGTYINNGGVYIPNAGTDYYTTDRTAYTITGYSFTANGVTATTTASIAIKQKANTRTETPEYYLAFISQSATSIANAGGTFTFVAESLVRTKYTYLTNQTAYSTYSNSDASVTYSNGVTKVSPSTISGKQTVTVTVGSNYDSARTPKVIVTSKGDSSKTISVTVSQAAASYDFYFVDQGTIDAYGATFNITLVSKVNGAFKTVVPESVKLSEGKINSITANSSEGKYSVNVTIPANSSTTSTKSYTISAQQYDTGKTTSLKITQAKKTSSYVTGSVAIKNLVSGLYVSSDGMLAGFNQYPTFTITAESNGTVNSCKYMFCLDFEIQTSNGQTFNARYEHQMDYIDIQAFSGTKEVQFINFPQSFNLQELTNYVFDPYYSSVMSIRVIADIERVSGDGLLMLGGSISDYTWYV